MTQLLVYRERIQKFYQKFYFLLNPVFRFLLGFITCYSMNRMIGYHPYLNHFYVEILFGGLTVLLPGNVMLFLAVTFSVGHIYYVSVMLAFVTGLIFSVMYFAYLKFVPEHAYVIIAFPILFSLKLVYTIPIFLGLVMSPLALIPIICGVSVYYFLITITSVISTTTEANLYHLVVQQFFSTKDLYVLIFVFFVVYLTVYVIRNRSWNYAYEKAVAAGGILNIVLLLAVNFIFELDMDLLTIFLGTFGSMCIAEVIQFMRLVLNYTSVENLQFEDDEYYYHVRAVPKANVAAPSKRIKHFSVRKFTEGEKAEKEKSDS